MVFLGLVNQGQIPEGDYGFVPAFPNPTSLGLYPRTELTRKVVGAPPPFYPYEEGFIFLETQEFKGKKHDLYVKAQREPESGLEVFYIAKYGFEDYQYLSGLPTTANPPLLEAAALVEKLKLNFEIAF